MTIADFQRHGETAKADLLGQFKGKPSFEGWLDAVAVYVNELDAVLVDLALERTIETAVGEQLEQLGGLVGIERGASDDDDLRLRIRVEILINRSEGTIENVLGVIIAALGDDAVLELEEYAPAAFVVQHHGAMTQVIADRIASFIERTRGGGIRGAFVYSAVDDATTFTFASADLPQASSAQGWADNGQTTGGFLADVMEA